MVRLKHSSVECDARIKAKRNLLYSSRRGFTNSWGSVLSPSQTLKRSEDSYVLISSRRGPNKVLWLITKEIVLLNLVRGGYRLIYRVELWRNLFVPVVGAYWRLKSKSRIPCLSRWSWYRVHHYKGGQLGFGIAKLVYYGLSFFLINICIQHFRVDV